MADALRNFLKDEDRASRVLINGAVSIMALGLLVAVGAILLMK